MVSASDMMKYTEIRPVIMMDYPDAQNVFLKVTNQEICVSNFGCEDMNEAEVLRDCLCVALAKIVNEQIS